MLLSIGSHLCLGGSEGLSSANTCASAIAEEYAQLNCTHDELPPADRTSFGTLWGICQKAHRLGGYVRVNAFLFKPSSISSSSSGGNCDVSSPRVKHVKTFNGKSNGGKYFRWLTAQKKRLPKCCGLRVILVNLGGCGKSSTKRRDLRLFLAQLAQTDVPREIHLRSRLAVQIPGPEQNKPEAYVNMAGGSLVRQGAMLTRKITLDMTQTPQRSKNRAVQCAQGWPIETNQDKPWLPLHIAVENLMDGSNFDKEAFKKACDCVLSVLDAYGVNVVAVNCASSQNRAPGLLCTGMFEKWFPKMQCCLRAAQNIVTMRPAEGTQSVVPHTGKRSHAVCAHVPTPYLWFVLLQRAYWDRFHTQEDGAQFPADAGRRPNFFSVPGLRELLWEGNSLKTELWPDKDKAMKIKHYAVDAQGGLVFTEGSLQELWRCVKAEGYFVSTFLAPENVKQYSGKRVRTVR